MNGRTEWLRDGRSEANSEEMKKKKEKKKSDTFIRFCFVYVCIFYSEFDDWLPVLPVICCYWDISEFANLLIRQLIEWCVCCIFFLNYLFEGKMHRELSCVCPIPIIQQNLLSIIIE